jgi:exopolyphosphatase/guanosine-5'-triphosphate,3'-diphosphate pyrophosphatase
MRLAAIDIGTNTILMLIADVERGSIKEIIRDEHDIARLGEGVDAQRNISAAAFHRALGCLRDYVQIAADLRVDRIIACGTSAMRDAANAAELIQNIRTSLDLDVTTLSKQDEANLTYLGAVSGLRTLDDAHDIVVVDIGGGSTEIVSGRGMNILGRASFDIGSVRLTERFLHGTPPTSPTVAEAQSFIREALRQAPNIPQTAQFIGVAGTLTTLAALHLGLQEYQSERVEGFRLTKEMVENSFELLRELTLKEIVAIPQILPERADIILAGVLILREILNHIEQDSIIVSDRGLRYGILLREAELANRS